MHHKSYKKLLFITPQCAALLTKVQMFLNMTNVMIETIIFLILLTTHDQGNSEVFKIVPCKKCYLTNNPTW